LQKSCKMLIAGGCGEVNHRAVLISRVEGWRAQTSREGRPHKSHFMRMKSEQARVADQPEGWQRV
jgi:hypothetical protein